MAKHAARCPGDWLHLKLRNRVIDDIESIFKLLKSDLFEESLKLGFNLFSLVEKVVLFLVFRRKQLIKDGLELLRSSI